MLTFISILRQSMQNFMDLKSRYQVLFCCILKTIVYGSFGQCKWNFFRSATFCFHIICSIGTRFQVVVVVGRSRHVRRFILIWIAFKMWYLYNTLLLSIKGDSIWTFNALFFSICDTIDIESYRIKYKSFLFYSFL